MSLIECKNLYVNYDGKAVVNDLSFSVEDGDAVCIVGENGSGKTTLVKAILGLVKLSGGSVNFGGGLKQNEIGYLPQQTEVQRDFPASVREIVLSGCINGCGMRPFYSKAQKEAAAANMKKLGISDLAGRCYRELSGGQQQRVLLARALCATKSLLVLDEPVAGLDPVVTQELYRLISDINKEGITVIMVSHDIAAAVQYATHILHISHKPLFFGTKDEYTASDIYRRFISRGGDAE